MKSLASFSFLFSLFLSIATASHAQSCTTATCTASSANESAVLAALPSSSNTNATVVVNIPSGTGTWTTGFNYSIPSAVTSLTIQGATTVNCTGTAGTSSYSCSATDNTVFVDSYNSSNAPLMSINVGTAAFRLTGITFQGGTISSGNNKPNGFLNFSGTSSSFRIDHSHFNTNTYSISNAGGGMTIFTNLWGVVDHSVFELSGQNNGIRDYAGSGDFGDTNWSQPTNFGTSGFLFAENNIFNAGASNDCDEGGKMVMRYNTIIANANETDTGLWQGHQMGQGTQRSRGCRALEIYDNYISNPNPSDNQYADGDGGSGTGLVWNNTISAGYSYDVIFESDRELATGHSQSAPPSGIGYCGNASSGATSAWDGNSNATTGYPCIDQTGRGQGALLNGQNFPNAGASGCSGSGCVPFWPQNLREPWYVWNETIASGQVYNAPAWNGVSMLPNQAFYAPNASFNGTSGTGFGSLAARPSTCTAGPGGTYDTSPTGSYGVGYFATDANSGNGELYVCTATNTWTGIYQPYTYPHPLVSGTATTNTPPPAPTGLVSTVN